MIMSKALYVKLSVTALVITANLGKIIQVSNIRESVKMIIHLLKGIFFLYVYIYLFLQFFNY